MKLARGYETTWIALRNAEAGVRTGNRPAAAVWLVAAMQECASWLSELDPDFAGWPQWRRFQAACEQHPDRHDARVGWRDDLRRAVAAAQRAFVELEVTAVNRAGSASRSALLAVAFEDLLHQVWLCEREWDFDNRVLGSPARRTGGR